MFKRYFWLMALLISVQVNASAVRLKDLARIENQRENALVGYGIVVGLSGTGDSRRNKATVQSVVNTLANFGVKVEESDINSNNVAAVMVTGELPAFAEPGDRLDVAVSSIGDARSLTGGTLLLTALYGPDQKLYALAQGALAVGGYRVESFASAMQKNFPTSGIVPRGATVERAVLDVKKAEEKPEATANDTVAVHVILNNPDYTTAQRVAETIKATLRDATPEVVHPGKIAITLPKNANTYAFIAQLENVRVTPDYDARIVINERTGTIVSGRDVVIDAVSVAHGDLQIDVKTRFDVSQPSFIGRAPSSVGTVVVPDTSISVTEQNNHSVQLPAGISVNELVQSLQKIKLSTRDIISVLQSIKSAGALHAEIIIQ